jgi:N-acetylneuraminic acid mutarotase
MKSRTHYFNQFLFIGVMLILTGNAFGQAAVDTWTTKASFGAAGRRDAVGFAIGSKGYVGTGDSPAGNLNDFWEYDPTTNVWTQKANFAGGTRSGAMGFGIGTKGYLGGGYDNSTGAYVTDFYEFDPAGNIWTAKATLPGIGGGEAVSFNIGVKGYYGTGFNSNTPPYCTAGFYEYDPSANTWTTKASFPGGSRYGSIGFGIGAKGYVGSGSNCVTGDVNTFYEFDPTANTWTAKASYPGAVRESATGFSIGSRGYVANGRNGSAEYNDFYEYDPATNIWTAKATPLGGTRLGAVGFGIGSKGYLATGYDFASHSGNASYLNDMYEYSACPVNNQAVAPATATAVCSGAVNFTVSSEAGVNYYVRNSSNVVLSGPVAGTGSVINLPSGNVTSTSTLNIVGKALSGALTFDGSNDRVSIPYAPAFDYGTNVDFTYEATIKFTASQANYAGIIANANGSSPFSQLVIVNNKLAAEVFSPTGSIGVGGGLTGTTVLNDGKWHQVAMVVTRSTNNIKLYVDGVVEANVTNACVSGNLNAGVGINIGSERSATAFFNGSIDEARIWNTARTSAQLTANANTCLTGTEPGLQAYYNFENGAGSGTLTDVAGGDNNGTLTNMNNTSAWTYGIDNCSACSYQMATKPVITINALSNQTVAAVTSSFCTSGSPTVLPAAPRLV